MVLEKPVVIDGRAHLLGRLASVVAKQILMGQKIIIVRAEEMMVSGSLVRNKVKYAQFRQKRMNTNPARGPFHFRSPAKIFWRTVRGMIPHNKDRGAKAMARLQAFEGIPPAFEKQKRMVVPEALKVLKLAPGRKFCVIGRLSSEVGWKHGEVIKRLEAQRKVRSEAFYLKKKANKALLKKASEKAGPDYADVNPVLTEYGF